MITFNETVNEAREQLLDRLSEELSSIEKDEVREIYFHDIVHEVVDDLISANDRTQNIAVIDDTNNEDEVDQGLIDNSSLDKMIATVAYGCLEVELFNDDL